MKTSFAVTALLSLSFEDVKAMKLASAGVKALAQTKHQSKNLSHLKFEAGWNPDMMDDGAWMSSR